MAYFAKTGWIDGYLWFTIGVLLRSSQITIRVWIQRVILLFAALCVLIRPFLLPTNLLCMFTQVAAVSLIWLSLSFVRTPPLHLCKLSFPIYVIHGHITLLLPVIEKRAPEFFDSLLGYLAIYLCVLIIAILVAILLRHANKQCSRILFGDR